MLKTWNQIRPQAGLGLIIVGIAAVTLSFWLAAPWAWLARMVAAMAVAGGAQWLPPLDRWLKSHVRERTLIATALGLALVWMLVQYSNI